MQIRRYECCNQTVPGPHIADATVPQAASLSETIHRQMDNGGLGSTLSAIVRSASSRNDGELGSTSFYRSRRARHGQRRSPPPGSTRLRTTETTLDVVQDLPRHARAPSIMTRTLKSSYTNEPDILLLAI